MGLMTCPDCENQISTNAIRCSHCDNNVFYVATGKTRQVECPDCKGTGRAYYGSKYETMCVGCYEKKHINQKEAIDLRTNETVWLRAPRD